MRYLECRGGPRTIGHAHGEALRTLIRSRWETEVTPIIARIEASDPANHARLADAQQRTFDHLQKVAPDLLDEVQGIAEAAGLSPQQGLLLSSYNSLDQVARFQLPVVDGCTAIAMSDGPAGPLIFKTYDPFGSPQIDTPEKFRAKVEAENVPCFVIRADYQQDGKTRRTLGVRVAGSVWIEAAVNDAGLAFGAASLHPRLYPQSPDALPQHMIGTLLIKRCDSTAQVRALAADTPVFGKGYAMAFVDAMGVSVGVEKTAAHTGFNPPQLGVAFQTNHIRSESLLPLALKTDPDFFKYGYYHNSANRVRRIERSIPRWVSASSFDALVDDLYHTGACGDMIQNCTPACQHWITTWSAMVLADARQVRVTNSLPGEKQFDSWTLT